MQTKNLTPICSDDTDQEQAAAGPAATANATLGPLTLAAKCAPSLLLLRMTLLLIRVRARCKNCGCYFVPRWLRKSRMDCWRAMRWSGEEWAVLRCRVVGWVGLDLGRAATKAALEGG